MKGARSRFLFLYLFLLVFSGGIQLFACTSFAVYGNHVFYGMNFDYSDVEMRFKITGSDANTFFHMQFYSNNYWASTVGMNNNGFFSSCQMLYPEVSSWHTPAENEIAIGNFYYNSLSTMDSAEFITTYFNTSDVNVIHSNGITLHDLFADKYGYAMTLEVGDPKPVITEKEGDFIVMTNFANSEYAGQPYTSVQGAGADRYIAAYEYIGDHLGDFGFDEGIETLHRTIQEAGGISTQCSFLFDPEELEIYIILKHNFDQVWKVDLEEETIETYSGFDFYRKTDIGTNGITVSDLEDLAAHGTGVDDDLHNIAGVNVYPNPFESKLNIDFDLESPEYVELDIYDLTGRKVKTFAREYMETGKHQFTWNKEKMKSGIYFSRLMIGNKIVINKLICK